MSGQDYFAPAEWNIQCFRCGFKFKAGEVRKQWQGYYVCTRCWEPRQPQDFVRGVPDQPGAPFVQPLNWVYVGPSLPSAIITENEFFITTENGLQLITER
jgi:hypothetical protein